jgi:hypothetical protein
MQTQTQLHRMSLGCGYEPPAADRVHLTIWQPPTSSDCGYKGPPLTICAGYTANLPEVVEVSKARAHWKHGALTHVCEGEMADESLLDFILIFDAECSHLESWLMTPEKDGGGGR